MSHVAAPADSGKPFTAAARAARGGGLSFRGLSTLGRRGRQNAPGETPADFVARVAYQKAANVAARLRAGWILGADTVAECDGRILGKPTDSDDARSMLRALSGRTHQVLTGLCLWKLPAETPQIAVATTTLRMDPLANNQIEDYLAGGQWEGKAGAFGYQDRLGWIHIVAGSALERRWPAAGASREDAVHFRLSVHSAASPSSRRRAHFPLPHVVPLDGGMGYG